jgi:hypothetical protein
MHYIQNIQHNSHAEIKRYVTTSGTAFEVTDRQQFAGELGQLHVRGRQRKFLPATSTVRLRERERERGGGGAWSTPRLTHSAGR